MGDHPDRDLVFVTVSMAEILLSQNLVTETEKVVLQLQKSDPENPKVIELAKRLQSVKGSPVDDQIPADPRGRDDVKVTYREAALHLAWELTDEGVAVARARARYSGSRIVRLLTASPGHRGVRTMIRDIHIRPSAGRIALRGLPAPAVYVAAVGYLANTGLFVPMARSAPLTVTH
jgi:hypothetical protein